MKPFTNEDKLELYKQLVLNCVFEEKTIELYKLEGIPELSHN